MIRMSTRQRVPLPIEVIHHNNFDIKQASHPSPPFHPSDPFPAHYTASRMCGWLFYAFKAHSNLQRQQGMASKPFRSSFKCDFASVRNYVDAESIPVLEPRHSKRNIFQIVESIVFYLFNQNSSQFFHATYCYS